jgi:SAM-dependent methyltransferase
MNNGGQKTDKNLSEVWTRFGQTDMLNGEAKTRFREYFAMFPWNGLPIESEGFNIGCGIGRWARWVAPKVSKLHCIDPSNAIEVARANLSAHGNVSFHHASLDSECLPRSSQDFGYSLGVLHHVPDTAATIRSCVDLLKPDAPLPLYLYYAFDNRPWWFRTIWWMSDLARQIIYRRPPSLKHIITDVIALLVYVPLTALSKLMERVGFNVASFPLSYYRKYILYDANRCT